MTMRVCLVGAGAVGAGVGLALLAAGHHVCWAVRDLAKPRDSLPRDRLLPVADAARDADAIILATPWPEAEQALRSLGDLAGRVLIDATNPLTFADGDLHLAMGFDRSGAEQVAAWAPGALVVKTLNQTGAENMANAGRFGKPTAMFVAGDDAAAKAVASTLVTDIGFEALDAGPLRNARLIEPLAMLWIDRTLHRGGGRDFAFTLARAEV